MNMTFDSQQLSPEIRHRVIGRVMRAFSLLYRHDIGGALRATLVFRIDGSGGGEWHVDLSPQTATSGEGVVERPGLVIHLRETAVFCKMLTSRLNLPIALISGNMKLRGDLRLFLAPLLKAGISYVLHIREYIDCLP